MNKLLVINSEKGRYNNCSDVLWSLRKIAMIKTLQSEKFYNIRMNGKNL